MFSSCHSPPFKLTQAASLTSSQAEAACRSQNQAAAYFKLYIYTAKATIIFFFEFNNNNLEFNSWLAGENIEKKLNI